MKAVFVIFAALLLVQASFCSEEDPSSQECEPGTTFKKDCNSCTCTSTGKAACTKMACIPAENSAT